MTSCFEYQMLPVAVAHAIIAVVCNLKLWLNFRSIMELFIPLRSRVLRYMCNMADKELRTQGIKTMAGMFGVYHYRTFIIISKTRALIEFNFLREKININLKNVIDNRIQF